MTVTVNVTGLVGSTQYAVYCYLEHRNVPITAAGIAASKVVITTTATCDRHAKASFILADAGTAAVANFGAAAVAAGGYQLQVQAFCKALALPNSY